ncbi:MAG: hypothetical protein K1X52_14930 [Pyrinomonadaceae bacterium]|nr:hypothetical protein [Pyrinomonadaceae bacterium]
MLRQYAPQSAILAFTPLNTGSPMQDWCRHLQQNPMRRRELEEFAILGDVVVRIADEIEAEPVDKVKILSLEYAVKVLGDETDALEFVRCVRAIASPDAGQYELQQIASHYYGEIRRRGIPEVLKEMGMLGMEMSAVTAPLSGRELNVFESRPFLMKLSRADKRRSREAAKSCLPLPEPTPNFDAEMDSVMHRIGCQKITRMITDEFEEYYLSDGDKSLEELDRDFLTFESLEQYDENGTINIRMNGGQSAVVAFDFECEIDASYLPSDVRGLSSIISHLFVGHQMGGSEARKAREFIAESRPEMIPFKYSVDAAGRPFSDNEFDEWLTLRLEQIYYRQVVRTVRKVRSIRNSSFEYLSENEINPDYDEMQYVAGVCRVLWQKMRGDFHIRSLRSASYQDLYLRLRGTKDTAAVAELKKTAFAAYKERNEISLKEFTALNTVAKSQEARLANQISAAARKWIRTVEEASMGRLRFLKFALYNDPEAKGFTRQEKQRLWDSVRNRESELKAEMNAKQSQQMLFGQPALVKIVHAA